MTLRLNALEIVRCWFPEGHGHGDPSKPSARLHRVIVVRTTHEADGSQWVTVVFGTSQNTTEKEGPPCEANQIEIDALPETGLTAQTRFHFDKSVGIKVEDTWFPTDFKGLARGRVPQGQKSDVLRLIDKYLPMKTTASPRLAAPEPVRVEVKKKFTKANLLPKQPPADS